MIKIILNDKSFEYDVRSLTKAFFAKEDLTLDENCVNYEYVLEIVTNCDIIVVRLSLIHI